MSRNRKAIWFDLDKPKQAEAYDKLVNLCPGRLNMDDLADAILNAFDKPSQVGDDVAVTSMLRSMEERLIRKLDSMTVVSASAPSPQQEEEDFDPNEVPDFLLDFL